MKVSELIDLLKTFPQDAVLGKVYLPDDTGLSDEQMEIEDWNLATDVKNGDGTPSDEKLVFCTFGELQE